LKLIWPIREARPFHFDQIFNQIAELIAERAATKINESVQRGMRDGARAVSALKGRRLDMRCHYPGCKNRSKGPRFRFMCEQHMKLSKREQIVALETWRNGGRGRTRNRSISRQRRALRLAD